MRRSAFFTALLCAAIVPAFAASSAPAPKPPVPLLWKVSDSDNSVYLLGSFHMLRADDYPLSPDVDAALADAEAVLFELPPEEMGSKELAAKLMSAAVRTDGTMLDSDLTPALRAQLTAWTTKNEAALRKVNLTPQVLQALEPWFVSLLLTIVEAGEGGFEADLGLDEHMAKAAKAANKPATGLETGAMQLEMLDGMTRDTQVQMLAESLQSEAGKEHELVTLHREWRNGNAEALLKFMATDTLEKYPDLYARMNTERNDAWVPKLDALLKTPGKDDTLVVVGSMHLLGSDGVVEKLKKKGYKVERVCTACK